MPAARWHSRDFDPVNVLVEQPERVASNVRERFWRKVERLGPNDCWPWLAGKNEHGYGGFTIRLDGRSRHLKAPRIAWALANGLPIPATLCVRHRCDNPGCCNPNHLELGSISQNTQDAIIRGRHSPPPIHSGEKHHNSKITDKEREFIRNSPLNRNKLAIMFGLAHITVSRIKGYVPRSDYESKQKRNTIHRK